MRKQKILGRDRVGTNQEESSLEGVRKRRAVIQSKREGGREGGRGGREAIRDLQDERGN